MKNCDNNPNACETLYFVDIYECYIPEECTKRPISFTFRHLKDAIDIIDAAVLAGYAPFIYCPR